MAVTAINISASGAFMNAPAGTMVDIPISVPANSTIVVAMHYRTNTSFPDAFMKPFAGMSFGLDAQMLSYGIGNDYTDFHSLKCPSAVSGTLSWPHAGNTVSLGTGATAGYYFVFTGGNINAPWPTYPVGESVGKRNPYRLSTSTTNAISLNNGNATSVTGSRWLSYTATTAGTSLTVSGSGYTPLYSWVSTSGGLSGSRGAIGIMDPMTAGAAYNLTASRGGDGFWMGGAVEILPDDGEDPSFRGWGMPI